MTCFFANIRNINEKINISNFKKLSIFFRHAETLVNIGLVEIQDEKYFFHNIFRHAETLVNSRVTEFWVEKMKKNTASYIGVFYFLFSSMYKNVFNHDYY